MMSATHPESALATDLVKRYVRFGSSPRGAQALTLVGKVYAGVDGRLQVGFEDIRRAAASALRHRVLLNFEGEAEGISTDRIVADLLEKIPEVDG